MMSDQQTSESPEGGKVQTQESALLVRQISSRNQSSHNAAFEPIEFEDLHDIDESSSLVGGLSVSSIASVRYHRKLITNRATSDGLQTSSSRVLSSHHTNLASQPSVYQNRPSTKSLITQPHVLPSVSVTQPHVLPSVSVNVTLHGDESQQAFPLEDVIESDETFVTTAVIETEAEEEEQIELHAIKKPSSELQDQDAKSDVSITVDQIGARKLQHSSVPTIAIETESGEDLVATETSPQIEDVHSEGAGSYAGFESQYSGASENSTSTPHIDTEIPPVIMTVICRELYPIVRETYKEYQKILGKKHRMTEQTRHRLSEMAHVMQQQN